MVAFVFTGLWTKH